MEMEVGGSEADNLIESAASYRSCPDNRNLDRKSCEPNTSHGNQSCEPNMSHGSQSCEPHQNLDSKSLETDHNLPHNPVYSNPCQLRDNSDSNPCQLHDNSDSNPCQLRDNSDSNPCQLHDNSDSNPCQLHDNSDSNPCQLRDNSDSNPCQLHDNSDSNPCQLHDNSDSNPCQLRDNSDSNPCQLHDNPDSNPCQLHDNSDSNPCQLHDNSDSNPCQPHDNSDSNPCQLHDNPDSNPCQLHDNSDSNPCQLHDNPDSNPCQLRDNPDSNPCQLRDNSDSNPCQLHDNPDSDPCPSNNIPETTLCEPSQLCGCSCEDGQCCEGTSYIPRSPHETSWEDQVAKEVIQKWEREQSEYREKLIIKDTEDIISWLSVNSECEDVKELYIGGADISFIKGNNVDACSCLTIVRASDLEVVYQRIEMIQLTQPYVPGYLAFREVQPLVDHYNQLRVAAPHYLPDVIMVDGNGVLHPRGFGLACHLGVVLGVPTLGVAKTLITAQGIHDDQDHKLKKQTLKQAGDFFDLVSDSGAVLGRCVRTCDKAPNPIYISVGHRITLESATQISLRCSKYRIPEPVRKADIDSREFLRQKKVEPYEFIKE